MDDVVIVFYVDKKMNTESDMYQDITIIKKFNPLYDLYRLFEIVRNYKKCDLYLASINNYIFQIIILIGRFDNLFTFDDGTANLFRNSFFYHSTGLKARIRKILINTILRAPNVDDIKLRRGNHYTIFPFSDGVYVPLLECKVSSEISKCSKRNLIVFVGGCYDELSYNPNLLFERVKKFVEDKYSSYIYLPHPRCSYKPKGFMLTINVSDTAEDLLTKLTLNYSKIILVGTVSTLNFNLNSMGNFHHVILSSCLIKEQFTVDKDIIHNLSSYELVNVDR